SARAPGAGSSGGSRCSPSCWAPWASTLPHLRWLGFMDAAAPVLEDRLTRDEVAPIRGQEESHGSLPASRRGTPRPYNKSRIRARSPPREATRRRLARLEQEYMVNARIEDLESRLRSAA